MGDHPRRGAEQIRAMLQLGLKAALNRNIKWMKWDWLNEKPETDVSTQRDLLSSILNRAISPERHLLHSELSNGLPWNSRFLRLYPTDFGDHLTFHLLCSMLTFLLQIMCARCRWIPIKLILNAPQRRDYCLS